MWSDKKYVNIIIDVLLFLVGINFSHYGQLMLPVICLILFIDNKFRFEVNDIRIFVILCLFGISFCYFAYTDGFYCVMGFCLPMAYYIGSNLKSPSEENIRKLIFLFAFSMGCHVVLNSVFELAVHGTHGFFLSSTHYDVWTREKISNTTTAVNIDLLIACLYYLLWHEKNRKTKIACLTVFALAMFYCVVIGRRTPVLLLVILFMFSFIFESIVYRKADQRIKKAVLISIAAAAAMLIGIILFYSFDLFGCREFLDNLNIIIKFKNGIVDNSRISYYFGAIKLMPKYMFGGRKISSELGGFVHDFGLDIYDYAGIVPYFFIAIYSLCFAYVALKVFMNKHIDNKAMLLSVFICIIIQMFIEPVMSGSTIFLICSIIIEASIERMLKENEGK